MNPTNHILESRYAQLEGGHPLSGLTVSSGTTAIFYSIINLASEGDNIVAARALYGGTFTMFNDLLPKFGIEGSLLVLEMHMAILKFTFHSSLYHHLFTRKMFDGEISEVC